MFDPLTLQGIANAIGLPVSEVGPLLLESQDGPTTENSGPAPRRASRSRSQAKEKATPTIGTYGPTFFDSSKPVGPLSSWVSRLQRRLARTGSTECSLTWKESATPAGRQLFRLVPSTRPTDATAFGLWPTPTKTQAGGTPEQFMQRKRDSFGAKNPTLSDLNLCIQAMWPTPMASEVRQGFQDRSRGKKGSQESLTTIAVKALWPTPTSLAPAKDGNNRSGQFGGAGGNPWAHSGWIIGHDGKARRVGTRIRLLVDGSAASVAGLCAGKESDSAIQEEIEMIPLLAHGVPARVGKLRAFGNAIVPQVGRRSDRRVAWMHRPLVQ